MSIHLDPTKPSPNIHSQPKPKTSLLRCYFERYVHSVHESYQMEVKPTKMYCLNKWNKGEKNSTQIFETFMKDCTEKCEDYKRFAEWHRRN